MKINNFEDFCEALKESGFSMGGGNDKGIFALIDFDWRGAPEDTPVRWHTGDRETDPWEWRMRVLEERTDVAYAKLFFRAAGYITKEWYPYFLAVRRRGKDFEELLSDGEISYVAEQIYKTIRENGALPMHALKELCGVTKEESGAFERALVDLQTKLLITMCGRAQKLNRQGAEYGWNSTVFCTVEDFWGDCMPEVAKLSARISPKEAEEKIRAQILRLNPSAEEKKIKKFICG